MATKKEFSVGRLFLQIALGTLLIVGGIWAITGNGDFGITALNNIRNLLNLPDIVYTILKISYGVIELIIGVFVVIEIFAGDILATFGKILKIIIIVSGLHLLFLHSFFQKVLTSSFRILDLILNTSMTLHCSFVLWVVCSYYFNFCLK